MKKYFIFLVFLLNYLEIMAQDISTKEASTKIGEEVRMVGRVVSVVYWDANAGNKNCYFINLDQPFPNNPVVVKILKKDYKKFKSILKDIRQESNVRIRVTGTVFMWQPEDREISPTIELKKPTQIDILYN